MQFTALSAMALIHKDEQFADCWARLLLQFLDKRIEISNALLAELMDQRAEQARLGLAELRHQIVPTARAVNGFARAGEHPLDLFVQFVAVGEDKHTRVWLILQNPFGKQDHDDAFATALRVPDNAAFIGLDALGSLLDAEILMYPRQLLHAAIK